MSDPSPSGHTERHEDSGGVTGAINGIVKVFLDSHLSIVLIVIAAAVGIAALLITPREEDPQIVVPIADVMVDFPGHSAHETEQLVATPLERLLFQIDGVEYVYSRSMRDRAVVTVRFFVGEDRERSLVKINKKLDEHMDILTPGVAGWLVKPREIDDVPVVTLTLASKSGDAYAARRVAEELTQRLASDRDVSRAYIVGSSPRVLAVELDADRLESFGLAPLDIQRSIGMSNQALTGGTITRADALLEIEVGATIADAEQLRELVVGAHDGQPIKLREVATVTDGPDETTNFVRFAWGPAASHTEGFGSVGSVLGGGAPPAHTETSQPFESIPAVTIAIAKKKGTNAVSVAERIIKRADELMTGFVPHDIDVIVTRNYGINANEKVNELVQGLGVAIVIVIALLTLGLGWRESIIVAVAVPVVFGLTLLVNMLFGYTINRVTLFALILSLGLIVDDPIVDVENIARLFHVRGRATRAIVLEAIAEIRPPLIVATLAVIASFIPLSFISGMMGPYMAPMALNVPVAMLMSMLVAFTITPWLSYHMLKGPIERKRARGGFDGTDAEDDVEAIRGSLIDRVFRPIITPMVSSRVLAVAFLGLILLLTVVAASLAGLRKVPLKMLPFDNKTELLLVLDADEGTTLERTDAFVRELEEYLAGVPEVTSTVSYTGVGSPIDFNGLVRQYYFRRGEHLGEIRVNLVGKKHRAIQSHALGLRMRDDLTAIAADHNATVKIVEIPPGPPVVSTVVAEVYGRPDHSYQQIMDAAAVVRERLEREPGVVDIDDTAEVLSERLAFVVDQEKAAVTGVSVADIAQTVRLTLDGLVAGTIRAPRERYPLLIELRLPEAERSSMPDLGRLHVRTNAGGLVPITELGSWRRTTRDQTIYHKNLNRVAYVFAETAGRVPPDVVIDTMWDRAEFDPDAADGSPGWVEDSEPRPAEGRTFATNGSGVRWAIDPAFDIKFAGEGEWKITLRVFRDLGLAFGAALIAIYILMSAQTGSFVLPLVIMLAIPLTVIGIMPGFWLLNVFGAGSPGGYGDPVLFTATAMIGMIALAGIVTRQSTILVDFIHLELRRGRDLREALIASCVVRLRPILLTAGTAMLSAAPIIIDPIFNGLAWALIFGLGAATVFTVFVIPVVYWLLYAHKPGHGVKILED